MVRDTNYLSQVVSYIKKNLRKGYTKESLKWALINQGHSRQEIERAFNIAEEELTKEAPLLKTKPEIKYEIVEPKQEIVTSKPEKEPFWKKWFN